MSDPVLVLPAGIADLVDRHRLLLNPQDEEPTNPGAMMAGPPTPAQEARHHLRDLVRLLEQYAGPALAAPLHPAIDRVESLAMEAERDRDRAARDRDELHRIAEEATRLAADTLPILEGIGAQLSGLRYRSTYAEHYAQELWEILDQTADLGNERARSAKLAAARKRATRNTAAELNPPDA